MRLHEITRYLDDYLRVAEVPDAPTALNGLQVENRGEVTRIAAAVDASEAAIRAAAARGCDLLLAHHGLFWDGLRPLTGRRYRKFKLLLDNNIALYAAHIPLDIHPEVGNSVRLARALGIEPEGWFGEYRGVLLGVWGRVSVEREGLARRLESVVGGPVRLLAGGPEWVERVGVVTGAGGELIEAAVAAGLDAYVTGEGRHHSYFDAMEGGVNVYYAGHYATETWGVRALAEHLASEFGLSWEFLDQPTGL